MIKRSFFGITLGDKQKFTYHEEQNLLCYTITQITLINEGESKLYGYQNNKKTLIASLNQKRNRHKCKLIIDDNNFTHIFCVGEGQIQILGYKLEKKNNQQSIINQNEQQQEKLVYNDEFRALQPVEERELDSDELILLSKKEKKEYKKKQKKLQNQQN